VVSQDAEAVVPSPNVSAPSSRQRAERDTPGGLRRYYGAGAIAHAVVAGPAAWFRDGGDSDRLPSVARGLYAREDVLLFRRAAQYFRMRSPTALRCADVIGFRRRRLRETVSPGPAVWPSSV